ncbi:hypothetical protein periplasmic [Aspergillus fumigatus]|nr:hypothetical protein periplasmic [Aspergillus fumigatus]
MKITAKGIATPIPAFAPVERPVDWTPGSTGSDVAIAVAVSDTVRALTCPVAPDSQEKALSATGCLLCNSVYWLM